MINNYLIFHYFRTFAFSISNRITICFQVLNPLDSQCDNPNRIDAICVSNLQSAVPVDKDIFTKKPDAQIYLSFSFHQYDLQNLFAPNRFDKFLGKVYEMPFVKLHCNIK
jgi:hypothetical protein